jgi:O-antigen ligase
MNEFVNWSTLGTYGGALMMVMILTQFTKDLKFIKKIPTQIWSCVLAFVVIFCALAFTGGLTLSAFAQTFFNAVIVSVAANGGFGAFKKMASGKSDNEK